MSTDSKALQVFFMDSLLRFFYHANTYFSCCDFLVSDREGTFSIIFGVFFEKYRSLLIFTNFGAIQAFFMDGLLRFFYHANTYYSCCREGNFFEEFRSFLILKNFRALQRFGGSRYSFEERFCVENFNYFYFFNFFPGLGG
jgi:hypothetical protein